MTLSEKLVDKNHPILSRRVDQFDFDQPPIDPIELATHLVEMLNKYNGLGLAANQLGLPYRAFAMRTEPRLVCFNPQIVYQSDDHIVLEEGCLTYPGLYVKIRRPSWIRMRFTEANGDVRTEKFYGITARCVQHELDHLEGINYLSRASRIHLDRAKRQKKLLDRMKRKSNNEPVRMIDE